MALRQALLLFFLSLAGLPAVCAADPVPTRSEQSPGSAPPACDFSHQYVRQVREDFYEFSPIHIPGGGDVRALCSPPGACPHFEAEMAAHCAHLMSLGGSCAGYPLTLNALVNWPVWVNDDDFDVQYSDYFFERVPYHTNETVPWNPSMVSEQSDATHNNWNQTYLNSSDFPGSVTEAQYACKQTFSQLGVVTRTDGCFAAGTRVKMEDGSYRMVEQINRGDKLWNPFVGAGVPVFSITAGPENILVLELTAGGKKLLVTRSHAMAVVVSERAVKETSLRTAGRSMKAVRAGDLHPGDKLLLDDGGGKTTVSAIESIKEVPLEGRKLVYNFTLEGHGEEFHYLVADGIVTGDLTLQRKVGRKGDDI